MRALNVSRVGDQRLVYGGAVQAAALDDRPAAGQQWQALPEVEGLHGEQQQRLGPWVSGAEEVLAMGCCDQGAQELAAERARASVRALRERLDGRDGLAADQAVGQVGLSDPADALDADQRATWSWRQAGCHLSWPSEQRVLARHGCPGRERDSRDQCAHVRVEADLVGACYEAPEYCGGGPDVGHRAVPVRGPGDGQLDQEVVKAVAEQARHGGPSELDGVDDGDGGELRAVLVVVAD